MTSIIRLLPFVLLIAPLAAQPAPDATYEGHLKRGQQLLEQRRIDPALRAFKQALAARADGFEAHRELGRVYRWQKNLRLALRHLRRAVALSPQDGLSHLWLGLAYESSPDYPAQTLRHLKKAIGLVPPTTSISGVNLWSMAYNTIGGVEKRLRNYPAARAAFEAAHKAAPKADTPLYNLAHLAMQTGRLDEARTWYEKLLARRPNSAPLKQTLARIKAKQKVAKIELRLVTTDLRAGQPVDVDRLSVRGTDKQRRIVDFDREWSVSDGLKLVSKAPLAISAGPKPSRQEFIYLTDKSTGTFDKVRVRVLGPATALRLSPEQLAVPAGSQPIVTLTAEDAVGNGFNPDTVTWSALRGNDTVALTATPLGNGRHRLQVPKEQAVGKLRLTARVGATQVMGELRVIERGELATLGLGIIDWQADFAAASEAARKAKRPLLLYLYTFECPPCDRLEAETFSASQIQQDLKLLTSVKLNASNVAGLATRLGVTSMPSMVFISAEGNYVARISRFIEAGKLHPLLLKVHDKAAGVDRELAERLAAVSKAPKDAAARLALAEFYSRAYRPDQALAAYRAALELKPAGDLASRVRLGLAYYEIKLQQFDRAAPHIDAVLASKQPAMIHAQALYYRGLCHYYADDDVAKARAAWTTVARRYGKSAWGRRARQLLDRKLGVRLSQPKK